jgi:hypothetical protein
MTRKLFLVLGVLAGLLLVGGIVFGLGIGQRPADASTHQVNQVDQHGGFDHGLEH